MQINTKYIFAFLVLFIAEIIIALFVNGIDNPIKQPKPLKFKFFS